MAEAQGGKGDMWKAVVPTKSLKAHRAKPTATLPAGA